MNFFKKLFRRQTPEEYFKSIGREDYIALARGERAAEENGWSVIRYNDVIQIRDSMGYVMHEAQLDSREEWHLNKRVIKAQIALAVMMHLAD